MLFFLVSSAWRCLATLVAAPRCDGSSNYVQWQELRERDYACLLYSVWHLSFGNIGYAHTYTCSNVCDASLRFECNFIKSQKWYPDVNTSKQTRTTYRGTLYIVKVLSPPVTFSGMWIARGCKTTLICVCDICFCFFCSHLCAGCQSWLGRCSAMAEP